MSLYPYTPFSLHVEGDVLLTDTFFLFFFFFLPVCAQLGTLGFKQTERMESHYVSLHQLRHTKEKFLW